jgi:hypothetical protein
MRNHLCGLDHGFLRGLDAAAAELPTKGSAQFVVGEEIGLRTRGWVGERQAP